MQLPSTCSQLSSLTFRLAADKYIPSQVLPYTFPRHYCASHIAQIFYACLAKDTHCCKMGSSKLIQHQITRIPKLLPKVFHQCQTLLLTSQLPLPQTIYSQIVPVYNFVNRNTWHITIHAHEPWCVL